MGLREDLRGVYLKEEVLLSAFHQRYADGIP